MLKLMFRKQYRQLRYWDQSISNNRRLLGHQAVDVKASFLNGLTRPSGLLTCFGLGILTGYKLHKPRGTYYHRKGDDKVRRTAREFQPMNVIAGLQSAILFLHYLEKISAHLPRVLVGGAADNDKSSPETTNAQ